jgi:hypothetical protein
VLEDKRGALTGQAGDEVKKIGGIQVTRGPESLRLRGRAFPRLERRRCI